MATLAVSFKFIPPPLGFAPPPDIMPDKSMSSPMKMTTHQLRAPTERYAICLRDILREEGISDKLIQPGVVEDGVCPGQYQV